jgi:hypothetical protein
MNFVQFNGEFLAPPSAKAVRKVIECRKARLLVFFVEIKYYCMNYSRQIE